MPKNASVTLSAHFEKLVANEVASGRYGHTSEALRAGLRLLERERMHRKARPK